VKAVAEEMGIGFLGIGFQPKWALKDIPIMPKVVFYDILFFFKYLLFSFGPS
jgi:gamma-glutamylcysteine synthetase